MKSISRIKTFTLAFILISCSKPIASSSEADLNVNDNSIEHQPCDVAISFIRFYFSRIDSFENLYLSAKGRPKEEIARISEQITRSSFFNKFFSQLYIEQFNNHFLNYCSGVADLDPFLLIRNSKEIQYLELECLDGGADLKQSHSIQFYQRDSDTPAISIEVIFIDGHFKVNKFYEWP